MIVRKTGEVGFKDDVAKAEFLEKLYNFMEAGNCARAFVFTDDEKEFIKDAWLLTDKPVLYVCNVDEASVKTGNAHTQKFMESVKDENAEVILISAAIEADIAELESKEERMEFVRDMGLDEPGVNRVIRACYKLLNLITYFTAGEKKCVRGPSTEVIRHPRRRVLSIPILKKVS